MQNADAQEILDSAIAGLLLSVKMGYSLRDLSMLKVSTIVVIAENTATSQVYSYAAQIAYDSTPDQGPIFHSTMSVESANENL